MEVLRQQALAAQSKQAKLAAAAAAPSETPVAEQPTAGTPVDAATAASVPAASEKPAASALQVASTAAPTAAAAAAAPSAAAAAPAAPPAPAALLQPAPAVQAATPAAAAPTMDAASSAAPVAAAPPAPAAGIPAAAAVADAQLSEAAASAKRTREAEELLSSKRVKHEEGVAEEGLITQARGGQPQPAAAAPGMEELGPSGVPASQVCHATAFVSTAHADTLPQLLSQSTACSHELQVQYMWCLCRSVQACHMCHPSTAAHAHAFLLLPWCRLSRQGRSRPSQRRRPHRCP